jgi:hypothetical protein
MYDAYKKSDDSDDDDCSNLLCKLGIHSKVRIELIINSDHNQRKSIVKRIQMRIQ